MTDDFPDFGLVKRAERAERERDNLHRALELGWTLGMYEWALDRWARFNEDYLTPNGLSHDHAVRCCKTHGTHSMPHKSCILR